MYSVTSSIFVHFGHHVRGHAGPCISLHGHTWKLELTVGARELDAQGFVIDFDVLDATVLAPCHALLDHALALGEQSWQEMRGDLEHIGAALVDTRRETLGHLGQIQACLDGQLGGARNELPGGIKIAVFPFTPTSERLAEWLYGLAVVAVGPQRVRVLEARVFEALHPTELVASYRAD